MRKPLTVLAAAAAGAAAAAAASVALVRRFAPQTEGTLRLDGLQSPVEIIRDRWGVPHIYAQSEPDLFFAQGFAHAQDRLWQMELQRRVGAGRLSEILGEPALEIDRFFRVIGINRIAAAEAAALQGESRHALEAYAAGVNAYMATRPGRPGLEFLLLRTQPEPWSTADSVCFAKVMAFNLGANWTSELVRARLAARLGADLAADLEPPYPADNPMAVSGAGLTEGVPPPPNGWGSQALREALALVAELLADQAAVADGGQPVPGIALTGGASNQWVVDGAHSATGRPLLCNDTHLAPNQPGIWYQVHMVGGRYNVTGVSLPGSPGIVVGHNEYCAWGMTIAWQDCQDLYVERRHPEHPHRFQFEGEWEDAQVVSETIHVKGRAQPVVEEVIITRHGPIVSGLVGEELPLALRWAGAEASDVMGAVLAMNRAGSWEAWRDGMSRWPGPASNWNYADVEGNIGFFQAGLVPVRAKGYGLAPVPGWTGEYEWTRFLTGDELPQVLNPEQGWIAAANNLVVDGDYPHFLSADLENPCRAARVAELIGARDDWTIDEFARMQLDTYSAQAERFVRHLLPIQPTNTREHEALTLLSQWDFRMEPESVAASIYQVCRLRALYLVFEPHLGDLTDFYVGRGVTSLADVTLFHGRSIVRLLNMLDTPRDTVWLQDPQSGMPRFSREVLHMALRQALKLLREELGDDMAQWTWGRLNRVTFNHPLGAVKPLDRLFNRGPYAMGGDQDTLLRASGPPKFPFVPRETVDAVRFVFDLSDWDRCRVVVPTGQSGHVGSRHYDDMVPLWRGGQSVAMPFSRTAVEGAADKSLVLTGDAS